MKYSSAVLAAALIATSAFAADTHSANSRVSDTDHSAKAAAAAAVVLPNSDETAEAAPAAAAVAVTPVIKPVAPTKPAARGVMPLLKSAVWPEHTTALERDTWTALSLASHGAAAFDAYSTRASIESGRGYERNPLMKPFAGSALMYPAAQVLPLGCDYLSRRMMRSNNALFRHTWWLPQFVSTAGSAWVGVRNLHVAQ